LVVSTSHPFADWLQFGGSYFASDRVEAIFDQRGSRWSVPFWRIPLSSLIDEILQAGFAIERLVEPAVPAASADIDPRLYRRLQTEPAFLVVKGRR